MECMISQGAWNILVQRSFVDIIFDELNSYWNFTFENYVFELDERE